MTPEKFFDYLEGKLPPQERENLERALIADPELQQQFSTARQVHRGLQRDEHQSSATTRAGNRGRQVAAAFAVLVALNVAIGLIYIFHLKKPNEQVQKAREEALRHQLQSSVEKSAAAAFPAPIIGIEQIALSAPKERQESIAKTIIDAANKAGGSGTKGLPNDKGFSVLVIVPASAEAAFRQTLATLGGPSPAPASASSASSPNEPVRLEILLSAPAP
ncbi:MAG: hypothetical protein H0X40_07310 [Chthoniobacterales bacterium]|nr:hypothetical protein [Chthoniobacterales bacterium]